MILKIVKKLLSKFHSFFYPCLSLADRFNSMKQELLLQAHDWIEDNLEAKPVFTTTSTTTATTTTEETTTTEPIYFDNRIHNYAKFPDTYCCYGSEPSIGLQIQKTPQKDELLTSYISSHAIPQSLQFQVKPTLITAFSSDMFDGHITTLKSIMKYFPQQVLVVYSLGLSDDQSFYLTNSPLYDYREFDFSKYPEHVKDLSNFAWKALIWVEALKEFGSIAWFDSDMVFSDDYNDMIENYRV